MSKNYLIEQMLYLMTIITRVFISNFDFAVFHQQCYQYRCVYVSCFQQHELAGYLIEWELCKHFYWLEIWHLWSCYNAQYINFLYIFLMWPTFCFCMNLVPVHLNHPVCQRLPYRIRLHNLCTFIWLLNMDECLRVDESLIDN